jgi:hypothetical protein
LPEPVYYQAGCDPHVSNVRVTLSGIFASTVSSFDSGLAWTLPDGSFPPGVNGVPLSLTLQSDGSYTGSYDWGVHPPGLSGPYILNFSATALDSSGNALNKQVVTANFLPCPGLSGPSFPYHLTNFEFDCLSLKSSVMIFTFDQSISGNYQGKMGNQTWQCLLDQNNNHRLICTGAGVTQDIKAQVSLSDLQNPQITLTQDTTTPTCVIATPSNAACTIAEENACTSIKKTIDPLTCTCK